MVSTNKMTSESYSSPEAKVYNVAVAGILCLSGEGEDGTEGTSFGDNNGNN